jgi:Flp pilus assembly protein TadD
MAGLVYQALTRNPEERFILAKDYFAYFAKVSMDYYKFLVQLNPKNPEAQTKLGRALAAQGQTNEAIAHLVSAVRTKPDYDKAHYELGYIYLLENRLADAYQEFQSVIRLNPDDHQAFGNLGLICLKGGKLPEAKSCFETAVRLDPDDLVAQQYLSRLQTVK